MKVLYYESHVTIEPVFGERLALAQRIARRHRFRVADLLMQKDREATPERSQRDTFATGHGDDAFELFRRMSACATEFKGHGFSVWRQKIEAVLFDERTPS